MLDQRTSTRSRSGSKAASTRTIRPARHVPVLARDLRRARDTERVRAEGLRRALLVVDVNFVDRETAALKRSTIGRVRWQPPKRRFWTGSRRCCQRCTRSSGARPCSTKCSVPPGFRTRRSSPSAASMSGIVHIVHVDSAASKLSSGNGSVAASSPARCTGMLVSREPLGGKLPADRRRLDSGHPLDGRRVVGDVQARSEADLDDFAREPFAHTATLRVRHLHVAHDIDDPRQDVLVVGAHA